MTPFFISHELYLIYNPETEFGPKIHALALSVNPVVHEMNIMNKSLTPLWWKEILNMLHLNPLDLLDTGHPDYKNIISGKTFSDNDALEVLFQNPQLVKRPIAILHNRAVLCDDPNDILRLDATSSAEKKTYH